MRTKFGTGIVLALVYSSAACGGSQGETIIGQDGGTIVVDDAYSPVKDATTPIDTGTGIQVGDTGTMSTFIDSGDPTVEAGPIATPEASTGGGDSGGGGTCTITCAADTDCQSGCGPISGGVYCCDSVTTSCFANATSTCPDQMSAGDGGSAGY